MIASKPRLLIAASAILLIGAGNAQAQTTRGQDAGPLIAALQAAVPQHEKARACQQLAALGAKAAVPALAALLTDRELAAYARFALEAIPDPSAGQALRKAAGVLHGTSLAGVVNSIGVRRDALAVPMLARLARSADPDVSSAAIAALGRIASPGAIAAAGRLLDLGAPAIRSAAADALLTAADLLRADGKPVQAALVCERVRSAPIPAYVRMAATGRLLVIRRLACIPLFKDLLRSGQPAAIRTAIAVSHEMPGPEITRVLASGLQKAQPEAQAWLVWALLERRDSAAVPALEAAAVGAGPKARAVALGALGAIGGPASVSVLVKAATSGATEPERSAALGSLVGLRASGADAAIVASLPSCGPLAKAALITVLEKRHAASAVNSLLQLAGEPDTGVSQAAFRALSTLSRPADLAEILRLTLARVDAESRESGARAVVATCSRNPDVGGRSGALRDAYARAADTPSRIALLGMLGDVGTYGAYSDLKSHLDDREPTVRLAAVRALAGWHDATPVAVLLTTASSSQDPEARSLALRGATRMAGQAAEECATPSDQMTGWLARAASLVGSDADSKRMLLSAVANLRSAEGVSIVRPYLSDTAVEAEAAQALIRLSGQLTGQPRRMAKSVLESLAVSTKNDTIRAQADAAAKQIPGSALELAIPARGPGEVDVSKLAFKPLFDGKSFAGWEGSESGAFRIEDGAIVGGGMKSGLTRNEFLCTSRSFANFVLRAECRLVGPANGGIQIRSQRVPMSSEVCGYQADMDSTGQYWGCLYDESRRGMLVQADRARTGPVVKKDGWNAYEIRCEGPRIRLYVNGEMTAEYIEKDPEVVLSGIIGLQVHAGAPSETWYRNISIAELP